MAGKATHVYQAPKGTRDFYPAELAVRRHIEGAWRSVSVEYGFDEIDGPTFEHLDLYTVKSGPGIVSELFSFCRAGGETMYALRPEFTPTLARMAAARAAQLPKPVKWYSIPTHFRAERPQRGRLREFVQWNVDVVGDASPRADAEVIAVCIASLARLGLTADDVTVRLSHRATVSRLLGGLGIDETALPAAFDLLDRRDKLAPDAFETRLDAMKLAQDARDGFLRFARAASERIDPAEVLRDLGAGAEELAELDALRDVLDRFGMAEWLTIDLGIVRGLAYYTGSVFEVHTKTGKDRAVAGGGRYDQLIELFGGPPTPAVGFAMGDVVLGLALEERGLLQEPSAYLPRPDLFVINAREDDGAAALADGIIAGLRRDGRHVRHSYRQTRNVGKLLGDAGKARSRCALIIAGELDDGQVTLKNLDSGEQTTTTVADIARTLAGMLSTSIGASP